MEKLSKTTGRHLFLTGSALLFIIALVYLAVTGNGNLPGNLRHSFWLNVFFVNYTFMGDAVFVLCVAGVLRFYYRQKEKATAVCFSFLLTLVLIQLLKNILQHSGFTIYFEESQYLFTTTSLRETVFQQLPSGHTALAFALAACLSAFTTRAITQLLLLLGCCLLAFSRLYLAGHFLMDIVGGMAIGVGSSVLVNTIMKSRIRNYKLEIRNGQQELNVGIS